MENQGGLSWLTVVQITLIALKALGLIDLSWWIVMSPAIFCFSVFFIVMAFRAIIKWDN